MHGECSECLTEQLLCTGTEEIGGRVETYHNHSVREILLCSPGNRYLFGNRDEWLTLLHYFQC